MAPQFLLCGSFDTYVSACLTTGGPEGTIPYLSEAADPTPADWGSLGEEIRLAVKGRLPVHVGDSGTGTAVFVAPGPMAVCGGLLAGYLGMPFHLCTLPHMERAIEQLRGGSSIVLLLSREEATDHLLLEILSIFEDQVASHAEWRFLTYSSLITGRDLASVSWNVAKQISATIHRTADALGSATVRHFVTRESSAQLRELTSHVPGEYREISRTVLNYPGLVASLRSPAVAAAFHTHGSDACAKGGSGLVLCGLKRGPLVLPRNALGVLACGHGHPCPRGPHPLALDELGADVFMLGACNGLRLANSLLRAEFSLPLAFLDGPGSAYVGAISGHAGGELTTLLFCAAAAEGLAPSSIAALTNAFLVSSKLDRAVYMTLGHASRHATPVSQAKNEPLTIEAMVETMLHVGLHNYVEVLIKCPQAVELARNQRLCLAITSAEGEDAMYWFHRIEEVGGESQVRLHLFRFPGTMNLVRVQFADEGSISAAFMRTMQGLDRWLELWRLIGLSCVEEGAFLLLSNIAAESKNSFSVQRRRLSFDGEAAERLGILTREVGVAAETAAMHATDSIVPRLAGTFWLTNVLMPEYEASGTNSVSCGNCGGSAFLRRFRHPLHGEVRLVVDCLACGIVSDLREGGQVTGVQVQANDRVSEGSRMTVAVTVSCRPDETLFPVRVVPRISTHGDYDLTPNPAEIEFLPDVAVNRVLSFMFAIPLGTLRHGYTIKLVVSTQHDIGFAATSFFVVTA